MSLSLFLPVLLSAVVAMLVAAVHRRLPPVTAARATTASVVVVAAAAIPTVWIVALGYLAHVPFLEGRLDWCVEAFGVHDPIPPWIGVPAVMLAIAGLVRAQRVLSTYRRLRHDHTGGIEVADHDDLFAVTLPGKGGHVVISSALDATLSPDERRVVLAHEQAHGQHRHDRYLLSTQVAAALLPILRPLVSRLQFALERWADEHAVAKVGDRSFVARTLGLVALRSSSPTGALAFAGLGVPARMEALMAPAARPLRSHSYAALSGAILLSAVLAVFQLHHLVGMLTALCPG